MYYVFIHCIYEKAGTHKHSQKGDELWKLRQMVTDGQKERNRRIERQKDRKDDRKTHQQRDSDIIETDRMRSGTLHCPHLEAASKARWAKRSLSFSSSASSIRRKLHLVSNMLASNSHLGNRENKENNVENKENDVENKENNFEFGDLWRSCMQMANRKVDPTFGDTNEWHWIDPDQPSQSTSNRKH